MDRMKKYISILAIAMCATAAMAQNDDTNREVKLEREYSPVISDAGKIQTDMEPLSKEIKKQPVEYWTTGYNAIYPEIGLTPLSVSDPQFAQQEQNRGYARLGLGFWYNTMLDFGYKMSNAKKTTFDVNIHHLGTFAQKQKKQASHSTLDMALHQQLKNLSIFGNAKLGFHHWNYYALYQKEPLPKGMGENTSAFKNNNFEYEWDKEFSEPEFNRLWTFDFNFGLSNNPGQDTKYHVIVGYSLANVEDKWAMHKSISENTINIDAGAEWGLNTGSIGFNALLKPHLYSKFTAADGPLPAGKNIFGNSASTWVQTGWQGWKELNKDVDDQDNKTGIPYFDMKLEPYYAYSGDNAWVHVGVNLDFGFNLIHKVGISPQVALEWQAMPSTLAIYGTFTGRLGGHELLPSLMASQYSDPHSISYTKSNTYTPIDATVGLKIHPTNGLILNIYGNYSYTIDELFGYYGYLNKNLYPDEYPADAPVGYRTFATLAPDSYNLQMFRMGLNVRYEYKDKLRLDADAHYNFLQPKGQEYNLDDQYAWYKPAFEGRLALAWHITPKWTLQFDSYFATPSYALVAQFDRAKDQDGNDYAERKNHAAKLDPVYDINLGVTYSLNSHVALFLNATNLAFNKRMTFYGYEQQLTSFLAGATFQF